MIDKSSSPIATLDQHEEAWAKIHDLLAAGHWARAREIFDQATSAERDLAEVTEVCDIEIRRRMELERELASIKVERGELALKLAGAECYIEEQRKKGNIK